MVYILYGTVRCGVYTEVEAETPEEAIQIAAGRDVGSLCAGAQFGTSMDSWRLNDGLGDYVEDVQAEEGE